LTFFNGVVKYKVETMEFTKREPSIHPRLLLDVDNGIDFTFKGMGLKGNREDKSFSILLESVNAYCYGCHRTFQNIDGCDVCGTDRFISHEGPNY